MIGRFITIAVKLRRSGRRYKAKKLNRSYFHRNEADGDPGVDAGEEVESLKRGLCIVLGGFEKSRSPGIIGEKFAFGGFCVLAKSFSGCEIVQTDAIF